VFNTRGYAGASISDIMAATGLHKGGIYNHFDSKDELAVEAFDYAVARVRQRIDEALRGQTSAAGRLRAIVAVLGGQTSDPPVAGGCPLLNTAVEADDTHPLLRDRTRAAMTRLRSLMSETVRAGVACGELRADTDAERLTTLLIAAIEGGIMLSRLYDDPAYLARVREWADREIALASP